MPGTKTMWCVPGHLDFFRLRFRGREDLCPALQIRISSRTCMWILADRIVTSACVDFFCVNSVCKCIIPNFTSTATRTSSSQRVREGHAARLASNSWSGMLVRQKEGDIRDVNPGGWGHDPPQILGRAGRGVAGGREGSQGGREGVDGS